MRVSGGGETLYFVADLIPTASHVRIPFVMGYDMAAIETMAEKRALLERACRENAWICLEHDPETALARPAPEGDDFGWREEVAAGTAPVAIGYIAQRASLSYAISIASIALVGASVLLMIAVVFTVGRDVERLRRQLQQS